MTSHESGHCLAPGGVKITYGPSGGLKSVDERVDPVEALIGVGGRNRLRPIPSRFERTIRSHEPLQSALVALCNMGYTILSVIRLHSSLVKIFPGITLVGEL